MDQSNFRSTRRINDRASRQSATPIADNNVLTRIMNWQILQPDFAAWFHRLDATVEETAQQLRNEPRPLAALDTEITGLYQALKVARDKEERRVRQEVRKLSKRYWWYPDTLEKSVQAAREEIWRESLTRSPRTSR